MNNSGNQVSVPVPSKFDGKGTVAEYMDWRESTRNYISFKQCSGEIALKQYKECFTAAEAKEAISELTSVDDIIYTLDRRYYNKSALVTELTNELTSIQLPRSRPESAAKYVSTVLTRLKRVLRISKEAGVENNLASVSIEQMLVEHMYSSPMLVPYATAYAEEFGRQSTDVNFACSSSKVKLLVKILERADQALILFRANSTTHQKTNASKKDSSGNTSTNNSGGGKGGGGGIMLGLATRRVVLSPTRG